MKIVYIVHAVDTEGPLYESLSAKFKRIKDLYGIDIKKRNYTEFKKLLKKKILHNNKKINISDIFSSHLNKYNENWSQLNEMIDEMMTDQFRNKYKDSFNDCYKFTWHCLDHVGFINNPRKRTLGFHKIYDFYKKKITNNKKYGDSIEWHFHPMSTFKDANFCATFYFRDPIIYEILCRKILDRNFFPSSYRAGFQAERPDSNWFLEQWIPFDITNMSIKNKNHWEKFRDFKNGRSGNWRNAPSNWEIYNPDIRDYQKKGECKRYIGRALNILNRIASINQKEVDSAFKRADKLNKPVLMGVASHDWRDLREEVDFVYKLVKTASKKFKNVKFKFLPVQEAFQKTIFNNKVKRKLKIKVIKNFKSIKDHPNLIIKTSGCEIFGPQPFLAIKTKNNQYIHDNFDFIKKNTWGYAFHENTLSLDKVKEIAIATNDKFGFTYIKKISF